MMRLLKAEQTHELQIAQEEDGRLTRPLERVLSRNSNSNSSHLRYTLRKCSCRIEGCGMRRVVGRGDTIIVNHIAVIVHGFWRRR